MTDRHKQEPQGPDYGLRDDDEELGAETAARRSRALSTPP